MTNLIQDLTTRSMSRRMWVIALAGAVIGGTIIPPSSMLYIVIFALCWCNLLRLVSQMSRDVGSGPTMW